MGYKSRNSSSIFWRLCLRSVRLRRPQALLGIGSLLVGAAVCSLLLNLYSGVRQKMTESFSAFGPNIILAPRSASPRSTSLPSVMPIPGARRLKRVDQRFPGAAMLPVLYAVVRLSPSKNALPGQSSENVVAVGTDLRSMWQMYPGWRVESNPKLYALSDCAVGHHLATELQVRPGDELTLESFNPASAGRTTRSAEYRIRTIVSTGAAEDDQVFLSLSSLEQLTNLQGEVSTVELRLPGSSKRIEQAIPRLAALFPAMGVRAVRQIVYSEARVLGTLSRLLLALTVLILIVVALCVAATMTAIVIERGKDIALMKALGASDRVVMEFFVSEGAVLGLLGGLVGFGIGAVLARHIGLRLFGVALAPSGWVLFIVCVSTVALSVIATLFPVQMVRRIQPAVALKGA